jgi:hypothetical protein
MKNSYESISNLLGKCSDISSISSSICFRHRRSVLLQLELLERRFSICWWRRWFDWSVRLTETLIETVVLRRLFACNCVFWSRTSEALLKHRYFMQFWPAVRPFRYMDLECVFERSFSKSSLYVCRRHVWCPELSNVYPISSFLIGLILTCSCLWLRYKFIKYHKLLMMKDIVLDMKRRSCLRTSALWITPSCFFRLRNNFWNYD